MPAGAGAEVDKPVVDIDGSGLAAICSAPPFSHCVSETASSTALCETFTMDDLTHVQLSEEGASSVAMIVNGITQATSTLPPTNEPCLALYGPSYMGYSSTLGIPTAPSSTSEPDFSVPMASKYMKRPLFRSLGIPNGTVVTPRQLSELFGGDNPLFNDLPSPQAAVEALGIQDFTERMSEEYGAYVVHGIGMSWVPEDLTRADETPHGHYMGLVVKLVEEEDENTHLEWRFADNVAVPSGTSGYLLKPSGEHQKRQVISLKLILREQLQAMLLPKKKAELDALQLPAYHNNSCPVDSTCLFYAGLNITERLFESGAMLNVGLYVGDKAVVTASVAAQNFFGQLQLGWKSNCTEDFEKVRYSKMRVR